METVLWDLPLRKDWLAGHITIVAKISRKPVMQVSVGEARGEYQRMLRVVRRIVGLHNYEVRRSRGPAPRSSTNQKAQPCASN